MHSKRILLTFSFVDYLSLYFQETYNHILAKYKCEHNHFGLEVINIQKQDEERVGELLLNFLETYETQKP